MRIMVDTNVLISGLLFPGSKVSAVFEHVMNAHRLVISSYVIAEFKEVVRRKFPKLAGLVDVRLSGLKFELVYTPDRMPEGEFEIRDAKDYPVLYTAVAEGVDIFLTGDRDFEDVDVGVPRIMTPARPHGGIYGSRRAAQLSARLDSTQLRTV